MERIKKMMEQIEQETDSNEASSSKTAKDT